MTELNDEFSEPLETPESYDAVYQQLSLTRPERQVGDILEPEIIGTGTLTGNMRDNPNLSDMQVADKRLFPDMGHDHLNQIQVSRVFPDVYNPFARIQVKHLIKNTDLSVAEAIAMVNTSVSIAIDGEGRIDELGLAGVSHEQELEKEKNKGLGL